MNSLQKLVVAVVVTAAVLIAAFWAAVGWGAWHIISKCSLCA